MRFPVLLLSVVCSSIGHPIDTTPTYDSSEISSIQRQVNLISYIQNFKQVMADYVKSQYSNLSINEIEKVKATLEDFLKNFAKDLKETMEGVNNEEPIDKTNDEQFAEIKRNMIREFPDVTPEVADRIVHKLKKNLYTTRSKLDEIIKESAQAQVENSK
ncbi:uncharacterized protein LOC114358675 [Ostrinia furnacalis]|uniref:uncharacterized protein LOC114358675 n=1 Tax=Ostrinia furnacalis TaxID=93504 RepID=UPI00103BCAD9|nr:uncharacterized protein LOC114358675 [Ostrinia furnacalis]XP_028168498.1 uncharacterized protein LOC114358675 [Ostrinia furnacalis]